MATEKNTGSSTTSKDVKDPDKDNVGKDVETPDPSNSDRTRRISEKDAASDRIVHTTDKDSKVNPNDAGNDVNAHESERKQAGVTDPANPHGDERVARDRNASSPTGPENAVDRDNTPDNLETRSAVAAPPESNLAPEVLTTGKGTPAHVKGQDVIVSHFSTDDDGNAIYERAGERWTTSLESLTFFMQRNADRRERQNVDGEWETI